MSELAKSIATFDGLHLAAHMLSLRFCKLNVYLEGGW